MTHPDEFNLLQPHHHQHPATQPIVPCMPVDMRVMQPFMSDAAKAAVVERIDAAAIASVLGQRDATLLRALIDYVASLCVTPAAPLKLAIPITFDAVRELSEPGFLECTMLEIDDDRNFVMFSWAPDAEQEITVHPDIGFLH